MREFRINAIKLSFYNDKDCVFCKHCRWMWDYEKGPYKFLCNKKRPECSNYRNPEEHTCELFEEA